MTGRASPEEERRFAEAVGVANVPALLMVLVQLTGEEGWLEDPYRPSRSRGLSDNETGGLSEDVQDEIRGAALRAILDWRAGTPLAIPRPSHQLLVRMMGVTMGQRVPESYAPMIAGELALSDVLPREAAERRRPHVPPDFRAIIIGAGISGLCAAVRLTELGIPYTIFDKQDEVGGVWLSNGYPGAAVDTPNHLYSFSFAAYDWSRYFAGQEEILTYLQQVATDFGVREHIRFGTEVRAASYDEAAQRWHVGVDGPDGEETLEANVVLSAVGAFNKPKVPDVPGRDSFGGPNFHTAEWPRDIDLRGRRVAVVGNGASAMQVVPAIADTVDSLVVFQRAPQWASPFERFQEAVPEPHRFLLREVPLYYAWYRARLSWIFNDRLYESLQKDPEWPHPERSLNRINDAHREFLTEYVESEIGEGNDDLLKRVVPDYPPFGKRMLLDNGWFRTVARDDVELVDEAVLEVRPTGLVSASGGEYDVDVIVLGDRLRRGPLPGAPWRSAAATASSCTRCGTATTPAPTSARSSRRCRTSSSCTARTRSSVTAGASSPSWNGRRTTSCRCSRRCSSAGSAPSRCAATFTMPTTRRSNAAHDRMVWTHPGMTTYYRNSRGRVVVNNPFRMLEFFQWTEFADLDDYLLEPARTSTTAA